MNPGKATLVALGLVVSGCATLPAPSSPWLDFSSFERGPVTNTALACAPEVCSLAQPSRALIDVPAAVGGVAGALRQLEPSAEFRNEAHGAVHARYVAVTPLMRFRDDVDVLIIPSGVNHSRLAVYSRSRLGVSDLGTNALRITDLERRLRLAIAPERVQR